MNGNSSNARFNGREMRNRQQQDLKASRSGNSWTIGGIFILIGIFMLANNMNFVAIENWWVFFILIPAIAGFGAVVNDLQSSGRLTSRGWSGLIGGLTLSAIAAIFIFNVDLWIYGPIALVVGGLTLLVKSFLISN